MILSLGLTAWGLVTVVLLEAALSLHQGHTVLPLHADSSMRTTAVAFLLRASGSCSQSHGWVPDRSPGLTLGVVTTVGAGHRLNACDSIRNPY